MVTLKTEKRENVILLISKINYKAIVTEIVSDCVLMNKQISGLEIKS